MSILQILKEDPQTGSTQRYIDSRTLHPQEKGSWMSVDVTETVKEWMAFRGQRVFLFHTFNNIVIFIC